MDRPPNATAGTVVAIVALATLAGCDVDVLAPDGKLALERLHLGASSTREVLEVHGSATQESVEDEAEARIRVTTSDGDRESVTVDRNICDATDGDPYVCDEFSFGMEDGVELDESILDRVRTELDARPLHIFSFEAATVKLFPGDLDDAMAEVRDWPGVEYVERNRIGRVLLDGSDPDSVLVLVSGALPVERSSPTAEDGLLQLSPGDTVLAKHRSADGEEVTARLEGWPGDDGS